MNAEQGPDRKRGAAGSEAGKPASWRKKPGGATSGGDRGAGRGWTERSRQGVESSQFRRRAKLAGYLLVLAGLVGAYIYYVLFRPIPVPLVTLAVTAYDGRFPPNSLALEDARRLEQAAKDYDNIQFLGPTDDIDTQDRFTAWLERQLDEVRPGGPTKNVVILYVSAHGALDDRGHPCLLLPDHDPLDSSTWLPVADVLAQIKRCERLAQADKLLILDAGRIGADWGLGILYNGFADGLSETVRDANVPRLHVLNAASPGQVTLAAPELGGSVFGHYLASGLRGAADSHGDGRVSLKDLRDYLQTTVGAYVWRSRTSHQHPFLIPELPEGKEIQLADVTAQQELQATPIDQRPATGQAAGWWRTHEQLSAQRVYERYPLQWAELEYRLLRLEQLLVAGEAYASQVKTTEDRLRVLSAQLDRPPVELRLRASNLSMALSQAHRTDKDKEAASAALARWIEQQADPKKKEPGTQPVLPYDLAAHAVWRRLLQQPAGPTRAMLEQLLQFVGQASRADVEELTEIHFLRMLKDYLDWKDPGVPPRILRALRARGMIERLAVPADVRCQDWARSLIGRLEPRVRLAEDKLFAGGELVLQDADRIWDELIGDNDNGGQLAAAQTAEQMLVHAYQVRDAAWAKLPALAQWALGHLRWESSSDLPESLLKLISQTRRLAVSLDEVPAGSASLKDVEPINGLANEIESGLGTALRGYAARCNFFLTKEAGEARQQVSEISLLLSVPLLSGEQRTRLRDLYVKKTTANMTGHGGGNLPAGKNGDGAAAPGDDTDYLRALMGLTKHPALALLDRHVALANPEDATATGRGETRERGVADEKQRGLDMRDWAAVSSTVRAALANAQSAAATALEQSQKLLANSDAQEPQAVRLGASQGDQLARAAAALLELPRAVSTDDDPPVALRRIDWNFELLWHCRRALDDFWGPASGSTQDFFSLAGAQQLAQAGQLCRNARAYRQPLESLLRQRIELSAQGLPVQARTLFMAPDETLGAHQIEMGDTGSWPTGQAAVYVRWPGAGGSLFELLGANRQALRRRALAVGNGARTEPLKHSIRNTPELNQTAFLEAVALFRGHVTPRPFLVGGGQGDVVAFERPRPIPATVHVKGKARQISRVLFILDCSSSMREPMAFEGKESTRLEVAKDRLQAILKNLSPENYHVGLMLFGHRAGWDRSGRIVWRLPDRDKGLHPGADVELVTEIGPILYQDLAGKAHDRRAELSKRLDPLQPYGETPLYYALSRALDCFEQQKSSPRHIIVITDGVNVQSNDTPKNAVTLLHNVLEKLAQPRHTGTRIDIVQFGISPQEEQRDIDAWNDLRKVARDVNSGGDFFEARDPSLLLDALKKSLPRVQFYVAGNGQSAPAPDKYVDLGGTWTVPPPDKPAWFDVRLSGTPRAVEHALQLDGGEAIELEYDREDQRLEHARFEDALRKNVPDVVDPLKHERHFFVGTHVPIRRGGQVTFLVSVQNAMAHLFSPRPRHVWAEIRPHFANPPGRVPRYVFYDLEFDPQRPVPVLRFRVVEWPDGSTSADIRLWFRVEDDVKPNRVFNIVRPDPETIRVEDIPASFQVEPRPGTADQPYRVVVVEQHDEGTDLYNVRVQMTPPADQISHSYLVAANKVRHVFTYHDRTLFARQTPQVLFTSKKRLIQDAVTTKPIEVTVPAQ